MVSKLYYVYEWFIKETGEVFYIGKGNGRRFKRVNQRNKTFKSMIENFDCDVRIVKYFDDENSAYEYELERTIKFKEKGQSKANFVYGKNKIMDENIKNKISNSLKGRECKTKGIKLSEEHKNKLRKAHLGKILTDEHKNKISEALKGKSRNEEVRKKISQSKQGKLNPMYGKKQSQETIQKRIKSLIGRKLSDEAKNKVALANGKKVKQIDIETGEVIKIFNSCSEAGRLLNINNSKISKVCRGEGKTSGGFRWEYV